jgi:hypothetical protein
VEDFKITDQILVELEFIGTFVKNTQTGTYIGLCLDKSPLITAKYLSN